MKKITKNKTVASKALVYCRVSSQRQVTDGHGLDSQEQRCIAKAAEINLDVAQIFRDEGVSGKLFDRPAMEELINYLDSHKNIHYVVIFDDLKRFARDVHTHMRLKIELVQKRGAELNCLNFNFEDSPVGNAIEIILAATAQMEREQNAEQVVNKMKSCLERGHYTFNPPVGLVNVKGILSAHEPYASVLKDALEKFSLMELPTLTSVKDFINNEFIKKGINRRFSLSSTQRLLTNPLYCGYLEHLEWNVSFRKAEHDGIIELSTYKRNQINLAAIARPRLRKDYSPMFPLRGYAICDECKRPLTAGMFKGRKERKPYYLCKTKDCALHNKTIKKEEIENRFYELLKTITPSVSMLNLIEAVISDCWKTRSAKSKDNAQSIKQQISKIQAQIEATYDRIAQLTASGKTELVIGYEAQISKNNAAIAQISNQIGLQPYNTDELQTAITSIIKFTKKPVTQWETGNLSKQRMLLNMYFQNKMSYNRETGFQTADLPLMLALSQRSETSKSNMVEMAGVKPASKECSVQN
jgi:DNA invertase Pin-like site-specific DNA recombinase